MDFIVFILILLVLTTLTLAGNYYRRLFSDGRNEYRRQELLKAESFLWEEIRRLVNPDSVVSYAGLGAGVLLGLMFSYMGGIYGAHYESYFFHSALLPALWFFGAPYLKDQFGDDLPEFSKRFLQHDLPFFLSFSMTFAAQSFMVYGIYHAISFLWVFLNFAIILGLVLYKMYQVDRGGNGLPVASQVDDDDY
ncbi:MAG: hypothetical protein KDK41_00810 [Leptospiraceae bacterium]|nr:hypothetical protein [Leptospiraceae bacterium]